MAALEADEGSKASAEATSEEEADGVETDSETEAISEDDS